MVREVPVAVVDASHSALSREFVRRYDASPDVKVAYFCNSIEEARRLVAKQEVNGIVYLPEDLSKRLNRMEQTTVSVYCDMSLMLAYKAIFSAATSVSSLMNANLQVALAPGYTDHENSITTQPLNYEEVAMFTSTGGYGNFILPGVLMLIIQQTLLLGTGLLYGSRRERGFFITTSTLPILKRRLPMLRIITGRTLCMLLIYAAVTAYVLLAIPKMFHFVQLLHPADLVLFVLPYLLACIFFAMTIGMLIPQREDVMLVGVHVGGPAVLERRVMAAEQHSVVLACLRMSLPVNVWHSGLCEAKHHGCAHFRHRLRVSHALDTGFNLFFARFVASSSCL